MDSASGNDPDLDDDIEITVGTYEPSLPKDRSQNVPVDDRDQPWDGPQSHPPSQPRKAATAQPRQEQSFDTSFGYDNNGPNMEMPNEAMLQMQNFMQMMHQNGMNPQNMPFRELTCYYMSYCNMISNGPLVNNNPNPNQLQAQMQTQMQSMMQGFMANMSGMQSMGMPMMNMPNWGSGMNGFPNFHGIMPGMMGNGSSFNQGPQPFQQSYGDHRPNFNQRNGSFGYQSRGRGKSRGRGRGGAYQHNQQDPYAFGNMPFSNQYGQNQNQFNQGPMNFQTPQYDNHSSDAYATNPPKDQEQHADDNDFAPGGQEEVEEALGEEYKKKTPTPVAEAKPEEPPIATIKDECPEEPAAEVEQIPAVESPAPYQEPEEKYIPEAYREDLGETISSAPPSAPSGPSAKSVPFRERGHGRFPSRGRGSFHGSNGYAPRSPARPISQHQTNSPTTHTGFGVFGAPTGPRAMREKDASSAPSKVLSRAESDVGIKIRGTATQPRRDDNTRSATPRSAYDDYDDRDRAATSHRYSTYDKKDDGRYSSHYSSQNQTQFEDYDTSRDKKRRKSRRDGGEDYYTNDRDMQDTEMSDSQDRSTSHRSRSHRDREREKDKTRDKYSSSTSKQHKSSSRRYEDAYDEYDGANDYDHSDERTSRSNKKSSKHDERDDRERRDRDYERAEKDKHRKRNRHDREREDGYEDADEEESRRRSRKHKREHTSSRKDKDRERERERDRDRDDSTTDLGLRITGRSSKSGSQNVSETPAVDKDPHTLEREARNKERMLKEQQRRENAEKAKGLSGGRTRTFKYEDEIERSLGRSIKRR